MDTNPDVNYKCISFEPINSFDNELQSRLIVSISLFQRHFPHT